MFCLEHKLIFKNTNFWMSRAWLSGRTDFNSNSKEFLTNKNTALCSEPWEKTCHLSIAFSNYFQSPLYCRFLARSIYSLVISLAMQIQLCVVAQLMQLLKKPEKKNKKELNNGIRTRDLGKKDQVYNFQRQSRATCCLVLSWYYWFSSELWYCGTKAMT